MLASTPINTAFNYGSNQSSWWREPLQPWIQAPCWDMQMHTSTCTCTHVDCWNTKARAVLERMCSFQEDRSLPSFPLYLTPTLCLLLLTLDQFAQAKKGWKHIWPQNSSKHFLFRISKAASRGYTLPPSKNMKQQEENVYCSRLPTSQAEGKIGIFIMKRGRWLFDLELREKLISVPGKRQRRHATCRGNKEVGY